MAFVKCRRCEKFEDAKKAFRTTDYKWLCAKCAKHEAKIVQQVNK